MQGREAIKDLDIAKESGGTHRGLFREFKGVRVKDALLVEFTPRTDAPALISGLELVEE